MANRLEHLWAWIVTATMLGAVAWPGFRGTDGFPLSNYPMFSRPKDPVARVYHVLGHSRDGRHRPLSPSALGTFEVMQAHQSVKSAVGQGRALEFCESLSTRIADDPDEQDIDRLEVRIDAFDIRTYFDGDRHPQESNVVATCPVGGGTR